MKQLRKNQKKTRREKMRLEMRRTLSGYEAGILAGAVDLMGWKDHRVWSAWEQGKTQVLEDMQLESGMCFFWKVLGNPLPKLFQVVDQVLFFVVGGLGLSSLCWW